MNVGSGLKARTIVMFLAGSVCVVVTIASGQSYYVDFAQIKLKNPHVSTIEYFNMDGDGYKESVFQFNMANLPPLAKNPEVNSEG